jgi:hypothetical protein
LDYLGAAFHLAGEKQWAMLTIHMQIFGKTLQLRCHKRKLKRWQVPYKEEMAFYKLWVTTIDIS